MREVLGSWQMSGIDSRDEGAFVKKDRARESRASWAFVGWCFQLDKSRPWFHLQVLSGAVGGFPGSWERVRERRHCQKESVVLRESSK